MIASQTNGTSGRVFLLFESVIPASLVLFVLVISTAQSVQAQISAEDSTQLTQHLEILSTGWVQPSVDAANQIFWRENVNAAEWEDFFSGYFSSHSLTDDLWTYLIYPVIWWGPFEANWNLQHGIVPVFQTVVDGLMTEHQENLGTVLDSDEGVRQTLVNAHRYINYVMDNGVDSESLQDQILLFYQNHVEAFPAFFKKQYSINVLQYPFLGAIRAQIYMNLRDMLRIKPTEKSALASIIGLDNPSQAQYLAIWNDHSVLVIDNNGLSQAQLATINTLFSMVPSELHSLGTITVNDFLGNNGDRYVVLTQKLGINIFGMDVGEVSENPFPTDVLAHLCDTFTAVLVHEVNHTVDYFFTEPPGTPFSERRDNLIEASGEVPLNYLRSMFDPGFFTSAPQEFFASISNQYFANSERTLELGTVRFSNGYTEPINQFIFFADVYSRGGDSSLFYTIDTSANIERYSVPLIRDAYGHISALRLRDNLAYQFKLDNAGNVTAISIVTAAPNIVTLISPEDGTTDLSPNILFSWQDLDIFLAYHFQLSKAQDFSTLVGEDLTLSVTSIELGPLESSTTYFWRVRASNAIGAGNWSDTRRFTVAISTRGEFDFREQLFGDIPSLAINVERIDQITGEIQLSGGDSRQPSVPFSFEWGDGTISTGFFPQNHTYSNVTQNYILKATAYYSGGEQGEAEALVRFIAPSVNPITLPPEIAATFPSNDVTLQSLRFPSYAPPIDIGPFGDEYFNLIPRYVADYVLSAAAAIQYDFVNNNALLVDGTFNQVVLNAPTVAGAFSIWFTEPVGIGFGSFDGSLPWSSFFHEMGHNVTLNTPADFIYGGKIDGDANAIYSECLAQIFQHATAYEILNDVERYGLSNDLSFEIEQSAISSMALVRRTYDSYVQSGMPFASWNDSNTPVDETFGAFMTIAYKFFEFAESRDTGYKTPVQNLMTFLQTVFDEDVHERYSQHDNTAAGSTFRSTLMVAAVSQAFSADLREDFKNLNFPVDDDIFDELMTMTVIPEPVILSMPENSATNLPSNVTFSWQALASADQYHLQVSTSESFTDIAFEDTALSETFYTVEGFILGVRYYWRVRASNRTGTGPWSEVRSFVVANGTSGQEINGERPLSYRLYQNYPNPFNPVTIIEFDLPDPTDVSLRVLDPLGREITNLVSDYLLPGKYQYSWDATGFASGFYAYQLQAGIITRTKTMILSK